MFVSLVFEMKKCGKCLIHPSWDINVKTNLCLGAAIGVCACDVDGDGLEEIYFLNTNNRYSGPKLVKDKLFKVSEMYNDYIW